MALARRLAAALASPSGIRLAALTLVLGSSPLVATASAQGMTTVRIAEGIESPTSLCAPPGDTSRLFVTSSTEGIRLIKDGVLLVQPFLDLSDEVSVSRGLTSMAFHPDYGENGRFYVVYLDVDHVNHLVEYRVSEDPDRADPESAREMLPPLQQAANLHVWDCLQFGPDGMLYLASGDGTAPADDTSNHAQDLTNVFGKLLRIDVDLPAPHIPADNPFVGTRGARGEIWAIGLRQPWRFSFDRATGDLYLGDVGNASWEEVNRVPFAEAAGSNFGWRCREGSACTFFEGCDDGGCLPRAVRPVHEYPHTDGMCAVIGGHVYRGAAIPSLRGTYFFADYCTRRVFSFRHDGTEVTDFRNRTDELEPDEGEIHRIHSFGEDATGELYILDDEGGEVFKIVPRCLEGNYCSPSVPNSSGQSARLCACGSRAVADDALILAATGLPRNELGYFLMGNGSATSQPPLADGPLCIVGGFLARILPPVFNSGPTGSFSHPLGTTGIPSIGAIYAGETWNFQAWFRDGARSNFTDAVSITFE